MSFLATSVTADRDGRHCRLGFYPSISTDRPAELVIGKERIKVTTIAEIIAAAEVRGFTNVRVGGWGDV